MVGDNRLYKPRFTIQQYDWRPEAVSQSLLNQSAGNVMHSGKIIAQTVVMSSAPTSKRGLRKNTIRRNSSFCSTLRYTASQSCTVSLSARRRPHLKVVERDAIAKKNQYCKGKHQPGKNSVERVIHIVKCRIKVQKVQKNRSASVALITWFFASSDHPTVSDFAASRVMHCRRKYHNHQSPPWINPLREQTQSVFHAYAGSRPLRTCCLNPPPNLLHHGMAKHC